MTTLQRSIHYLNQYAAILRTINKYDSERSMIVDAITQDIENTAKALEQIPEPSPLQVAMKHYKPPVTKG